MSGPFDPQDDAATPLDEEEKDGLIPSYITTRGELNEAEQAGILEAAEWAFSRKRDVLDEHFLNNLHRRDSSMSGGGRARTAAAAEMSALMHTRSRQSFDA